MQNQEKIYLHLLCIHLERPQFFSFPAGQHLSLLFIHILCEGCLPPASSGYILCWLFPSFSSVPSPPFFLFSVTREPQPAQCQHQTHLLVALGVCLESAVRVKGRHLGEGFSFFFFFSLITISCYFQFDSRR